jgi:hypothetical protein
MGFVYHNASQVNPLPKAAKTTVSPDLILPFKLPLKQLQWYGAVVFPYF